MTKNDFDETSNEPIELFFKEGQTSPAILIPILETERVDYSVTLDNGEKIILYMDEHCQWCEQEEGQTERSTALGKAIENYFD